MSYVVHVIVEETATHHIPVTVTPELAKNAVQAGYANDRFGVADFLRDTWDGDHPGVVDKIGDSTVVAVTERSIVGTEITNQPANAAATN